MKETMIIFGGKERSLRFNSRAVCFAEDVLGKALMVVVGNPMFLGVSTLRTLLCAGLMYQEKGITLQRVEIMLDDYLDDGKPLEYLWEKVSVALDQAGVFGKIEEQTDVPNASLSAPVESL